jgi:hypothetical protein
VFAHVIEKEGQVIAIAVWFLNFSTFTGRHGIYLEDLFVRESERRHGYVRDTKDRIGPILRFAPGAWQRFAEQVKAGGA